MPESYMSPDTRKKLEDPAFHEQVGEYYDTINAAIKDAEKLDIPLDENFVERVARERSENLQNPEASIEASREMVRNVVDVHLMATKDQPHEKT